MELDALGLGVVDRRQDGTTDQFFELALTGLVLVVELAELTLLGQKLFLDCVIAHSVRASLRGFFLPLPAEALCPGVRKVSARRVAA